VEALLFPGLRRPGKGSASIGGIWSLIIYYIELNKNKPKSAAMEALLFQV